MASPSRSIQDRRKPVTTLTSLTKVQPSTHRKHRSARRSAGFWSVCNRKRMFDLLLSILILTALMPLMLLIAVCIRLTSAGPAVFVQKRVGRGGRHFFIYKFRSMVITQGDLRSGLTRSGDLRVTWLGKWLRKWKLDELPQFYNVLRGDMSIVGPRPKLPDFADEMNLGLRPGVTGAATLAFRNEEQILASVPPERMEAFYHQQIKPLKASIDARYAMHATFRSDLRIIVSTLSGIFKREPCRTVQPADPATEELPA